MEKKIQLNDLFWTLQGEGFWTGRRALFVRFPYCNYDCPWCDTEYNTYKEWTTEDFLKFADQEKSRFAVLTGGEPIMHKHLEVVVALLKEKNFYVACETNGSFSVPEGIDFVTISPKYYSKNFDKYFVHPENFKKCNEWKYVVDDKFDFAILKRHEFVPGVRYSLSPEFSNMKKNLDKIVSFIQENPKWSLSLQTHKWAGIP